MLLATVSTDLFCCLIQCDVNKLNDGDYINISYFHALGFTYKYDYVKILSNIDKTKLIIGYSSTTFNIINFEIDEQKIVGLKYKGKRYYAIEEGELTASNGDVRKDKTFIGYNGVPETGTMEV